MKNRFFYNVVTGAEKAPTEGFKAAGSLSVEGGFAVYQRGYIARLTETLGDTYESVWRVLGDDLFFEACEEFITRSPSQSYNLSDYSVKFIDFMISHEATADFPFLPDLAHLGWLHKEVFHGMGDIGLGGEELMSALSERAEDVKLTPNFAILKSAYRLFDIWKVLKEEGPLPENWQEPQNLALYKMDNQVYVREISAGETEFFENLQAGMNILEACEKLSPQEITALFEFLGSARCLIWAKMT
ncbi:MAG: putative DNA-binding domain-containing protein [Bdellovibrionales bacterium]|nr:putative DNA-binding domain-containing protein [Bdellovibrionales bacterium]